MTSIPWMPIALGELGVKEKPGPEDNPRVLEYHAATQLHATHDEVPWCSAFVNWTLMKAGKNRTQSAAARDWLSFGWPLAEPRYGCLVILSRGDNPVSGHVGFCIDCSDDMKTIWLLGGNQHDAVSVAPFERWRVLGYRWPEAL